MRTRRHAVAYAQENRETGGPPGGHAAVTATRPAGGSPFPDSPRGFDFGFAHAASTPPDGPRSSSCAAGTRRSTRNTKTLRRLGDQTSQHVPQMQIRCPRVPGMRFGFMLNKRSQRNYRGTVLLRSHYRCGTLFSGTNHYHSKLARSTRMSHSRSHIGILRRLIRVYIGYPTDIRIT